MEKFSPFSPQLIPLEIVVGESFELTATYEYEETGDPINLTGYSARMQIRRTYTASNPPVVDLSSDNGAIVVDGYNGGVEILIPASVTAEFPGDVDGVWDLFLTADNGIAIQMLRGTVHISRSVTHE